MLTNYLGTVALTKSILPKMLELESGHIVVVTSLVGKFGSPYRSSYAASKHALHGFFDSLRAEIFSKNIKVTIVCPGFVKTNISLNALTGEGKPQKTMDEATENGLKPEYVADKIIKAIIKEKEEVYIGGKETRGIWMKRFFPGFLSKKLRTAKVV
jgi:dehydrogenase/reductase SDR family member 7B